MGMSHNIWHCKGCNVRIKQKIKDNSPTNLVRHIENSCSNKEHKEAWFKAKEEGKQQQAAAVLQVKNVDIEMPRRKQMALTKFMGNIAPKPPGQPGPSSTPAAP